MNLKSVSKKILARLRRASIFLVKHLQILINTYKYLFKGKQNDKIKLEMRDCDASRKKIKENYATACGAG